MVDISVDITNRKQAEENLKLMAHQANEANQTQSAFRKKGAMISLLPLSEDDAIRDY